METKNLALSSTFVVSGSGKGVVIAIGDRTVVSCILHMSSIDKIESTPIQKELNRFTIVISCVALTFFILSILFWGVLSIELILGLLLLLLLLLML